MSVGLDQCSPVVVHAVAAALVRARAEDPANYADKDSQFKLAKGGRTATAEEKAAVEAPSIES